MPQYTVGHAARLARIDAALAGTPGLHLTGAAYRGVGLAGCISQAARTAAAVRTRTNAPDTTTAAR
jgi:oxygen-dependent protoporphyrinogen oxidase